YGLAAAALYSAVVILNKKTPVADVYQKTIIELFAAGIVMIPYLLLTRKDGWVLIGNLTADAGTPGFSGCIGIVLLVLIVGIVHTGIAYALYFAGMQGLKAQSVAVLSYLDPVSALLLAAVILGERLSLWGIVGAVLILGAALVSELDPGEKNIDN
ncbi:MAG: DMT family transporter, partial [Clostridia bacterium]|nr:DMT family transporter [Clostridia bacterium]